LKKEKYSLLIKLAGKVKRIAKSRNAITRVQNIGSHLRISQRHNADTSNI
jgi:hypothetical protein